MQTQPTPNGPERLNQRKLAIENRTTAARTEFMIEGTAFDMGTGEIAPIRLEFCDDGETRLTTPGHDIPTLPNSCEFRRWLLDSFREQALERYNMRPDAAPIPPEITKVVP